MVRLKSSQVFTLVSATDSCVTCAVALEALRTETVAIVVAPDWATNEAGFIAFVAIGVTVRGTDTVMSAESVTVSALSAVVVAVLVIVEPSGAVVAGFSVTCTTAVRVEPAGIPIDPGGLGGAGSTSA